MFFFFFYKYCFKTLAFGEKSVLVKEAFFGNEAFWGKKHSGEKSFWVKKTLFGEKSVSEKSVLGEKAFWKKNI